MKGYILNDDARLSFTEHHLVKQGCVLYDQLLKAHDLDFILLGFNGLTPALTGINQKYYCKLNEDFFKKLPSKTIIYTGKSNTVLKQLQEKYHFKLITLMEEETIIKKNAVLTAEGLICEIIKKRPLKLTGSKIGVIGFGHCGQAIARLLEGYDTDIYISDKDIKKIEDARKLGYATFETNQLDKENFDIVINTAPSQSISDEVLQSLDKRLYLFDISSFPYGYHHEHATHLHDYILPGLPSLYGYHEAGKIIADYIIEGG